MFRSLIALLLCTGLAACGLKGPLVLPDEQTHEPVARPAATAPTDAPTGADAKTGTTPVSSPTADKKKKPQ